ncbi:hypothetical protein [uncultured Phascolarctobacterium sp.]|uniref:hypothetical protein n=1 Tax=uncultured Phascolarctobacterium sp. TaxID=512296 RepID=UPI00260A5D86|nr:hypothetical protein [uncultured Phascolarctobacterium sp.]
MNHNEDALNAIIARFNKEWQAVAKKAIKELYKLVEGGTKVDVAVKLLGRKYPELFQLPGLKDSLVEAAAYGYGIVPEVLTVAAYDKIATALERPWTSDGMNLSRRLHGASKQMREAIVNTIRTQLKRNASWTNMARELYDGYNSGKAVVREQDLPRYLQAVRRATAGSPEQLRAARQTWNNIGRLARNGAPTKSLKAAYSQLVQQALTGSEKGLQKACWVAVQEKSRYVAERIARTEMARAYADGFLAAIKDDDDVVAVKWKTGTRHPVFDICDMYAKADMYGLGAGIYPKDKLPQMPAHPHCMCRYVEVIEGEVDMQQQRDQVREAGDKWLNSLPESRRAQVLGRKGLKAWEAGEDWQEYMRGYAGLREAKSRLQMYKPVELSEKSITDKYQSPQGTIKKFQTRKVENATYDIHVSENVNLKPKMLAEATRQINKCISLLDVRNKEELPKIVIASNDDLNNALGSYVAYENKLYINSDTLHRKAYEKYLATLKNPASRNPLMTMLHEMIHWQDARKYVAEFGEITKQDEYMAYIIEVHRDFVDKLVNKRYNFVEISDYASKMYIGDRYDEVMTEYRVKKLLG